MGTSHVEIAEIRFVFEPELTQVYIFVRDLTPIETPVGVAGWHHKTYPKTLSTLDILNKMRKGDDPIMWDKGAP